MTTEYPRVLSTLTMPGGEQTAELAPKWAKRNNPQTFHKQKAAMVRQLTAPSEAELGRTLWNLMWEGRSSPHVGDWLPIQAPQGTAWQRLEAAGSNSIISPFTLVNEIPASLIWDLDRHLVRIALVSQNLSQAAPHGLNAVRGQEVAP